VDELLREGIAAAKSGQRERARDLLMRVVEQDEENVTAWLWLSGVVDSLDEREVCLENVLALDPANAAARKGLAWVRRQKEVGVSSLAETQHGPSLPPESPAAQPTYARKPVSPAAAVLRQDFARRLPPPEPKPEPPPVPLRDEFDDEYLCPYCAAQTEPEERKCHGCGNKLWVQVRRREERSPWLWVALTLQFASTIWPATIPVLMIVYAAYQVGIEDPFKLMPVYLGLSGDVPPELANAAFESVPRLYILPFVFLILLSLTVLVGLYLRQKVIFYLFLVSPLLMLGFAIAGMAIGLGSPGEGIPLARRAGLLCSGSGVILALLMFLLVLQIEDDFFFDDQRLLLRRDRDATNGPALLNSGQRYARRNMWALAAIHLRRATGLMPHQVEAHLALAVAYLNLKRYELAASVLAEARRISPGDPQVEHLASVLASRRAAESSPDAHTASSTR
jgi:tetratricopeptide (TPR) repeat protein